MKQKTPIEPRKNQILPLIICLLLPLLVGTISGIATAKSIDAWYTLLKKPVFNPPNYLFGPVWTLLYILMGISLYVIYKLPLSKDKQQAIIIFGVQLAFNAAWSFLFFSFHLVGWAFVEIIIIWLLIVLMIRKFYCLSPRAAFLQIPYLCWVSFASVLNGTIWWLNN